MVQKTEHGSSNQNFSPSEAKNARAVLKPCRARKCILTNVSGRVEFLFGPRVSFFTTDKLLVRFPKLLFWLYHIFYPNKIIMRAEVCKPDKPFDRTYLENLFKQYWRSWF